MAHLFAELACRALRQVRVALRVQAASGQAVGQRVGALCILSDQRDLAAVTAAAREPALASSTAVVTAALPSQQPLYNRHPEATAAASRVAVTQKHENQH